MIKKALIDSISYSISGVVTRGILVLQVPLFSAILTPADYGLFDLLFIAITLGNFIVAFEIGQAVAVCYSQAKSQEEKKVIASTSLWFTICCYLIFLLIVYPFSRDLSEILLGSSDYQYLIETSVFVMCSQAMFLLTQNQLRWQLRASPYLLVSTIYGAINIIASVIFVTFFRDGVVGLLWAQCMAGVVAFCAALIYLLDTYKLIFSFSKLCELLSFSIPLVPSSLAIFLSLFVDRICIHELLSLDDVGIYGVTYRIASVVAIVLLGFSGAFIPIIYDKQHQEDTPRHVASLFYIYFLIGLLLIGFYFLFSDQIMGIFGAKGYGDFSMILPIFVGTLFAAKANILTPGLTLNKKSFIILFISIFCFCLNIAVNLYLIPPMGILGAACGTLLSACASFLLWYCYGQVYYAIPISWNRCIYVSLCGAIILGLSCLYESLMLNISIFIILMVMCCYEIIGQVKNESY